MNLTPPGPLFEKARGDLVETHAMVTGREWLASKAWGLLMLGDVGRGKSQTGAWLWLRLRDEAIAVAQAPGCFDRAGDVLWLRGPSLARLGYQERAEVLSRCAGAYGLVVDEMGGEPQSQTQALSDMLEERGDYQRRTVITTNLGRSNPQWKGDPSQAGFLERYGSRLVDRLRAGGLDERGGARWAVDIQGESLRGKL